MKKPFSKLSKEDFVEYPIWEMQMTHAEPYQGGMPLKPDTLRGFLVRTKFFLADKTKLTGCVPPCSIDPRLFLPLSSHFLPA